MQTERNWKKSIHLLNCIHTYIYIYLSILCGDAVFDVIITFLELLWHYRLLWSDYETLCVGVWEREKGRYLVLQPSDFLLLQLQSFCWLFVVPCFWLKYKAYNYRHDHQTLNRNRCRDVHDHWSDDNGVCFHRVSSFEVGFAWLSTDCLKIYTEWFG